MNPIKVFKLLQDVFETKAGSILFEDYGNIVVRAGWGDEREIPIFICERNPKWFEDISWKYMDKEEKLEEIKKHFINLKQARKWCVDHFGQDIPEQGILKELGDEDHKFLFEKLLPAVEKEYQELEKLGVDRQFSLALFIFGDVEISKETLEQF